jgi:hypothetical protein
VAPIASAITIVRITVLLRHEFRSPLASMVKRDHDPNRSHDKLK